MNESMKQISNVFLHHLLGCIKVKKNDYKQIRSMTRAEE